MSKRYSLTGLLCILLSLITLQGSRAWFAPYFVAALFALFCLYKNHTAGSCLKGRNWITAEVASVISALFITLANYGIWLHPDMPEVRTAMFVRIYKLLLILIIFSGAYMCVRNILVYTYGAAKDMVCKTPASDKKRDLLFFFIPFALFLAVYFTVYFGCYYPGLLSVDSIDQITQVFTGVYSNHQPFYHTLLIGLFLRIGMALSGNVNAAVATYVIVQIVFMSATFAFVIHNMARLGLPYAACIVATIWYAVMPYHIMFSFTVWKDVPFGAFVTLLIVFFVRIFAGIGNKAVSYAGFTVSGLVMCLIRSNGLFAYIFVALALILFMRRQKALVVISLSTIVAAFLLKHAVLSAYGVTQPDTVESLSIPLQQVARTIADGGYITDEDKDLISRIADYDSIADTYSPDISDPVKNMIRDYGCEDYLKDNLGAYGGLYLRTLAHNPMSYVTAWIDSTCGYWNSGYDYWIWYWDVEGNPYGITKNVGSKSLNTFMDEYLWLFYNNGILKLFTAVGMFLWAVLLLLFVNIFSQNRVGIIAIIPILSIFLSLLVSSPVFAEFRYMYAMFCALPILAAITFTIPKDAEVKHEDHV